MCMYTIFLSSEKVNLSSTAAPHDMSENDSSPKPGNVIMFVGPMFASKTSNLIRIVRELRVLQKNYICVSWFNDTRSNGMIKSHDGDEEISYKVDKLRDITNIGSAFHDAEYVIVDEGHFFGDLMAAVIEISQGYMKHVVIGTLMCDFKAIPFEPVTQLMCHATEITFLRALCQQCKDGTRATYTQYIGKPAKNNTNIIVGGAETYSPVCAKHYLFKSK